MTPRARLLSTLAVAVVSASVFLVFALQLQANTMRIYAFDSSAFDLASRAQTDVLVNIAKLVSDVGSLPFVLVVVIAGSLALGIRRRLPELFVLAAGFGLVVLATHVAKGAVDRPRPLDPLTTTLGSAYPSGHSSYATTYVVAGLMAARLWGGGRSGRIALVVAGALVAGAIGATRIYLRAHYLSDVIGGFALGLAIFAACGALVLVVGSIRQNDRAAPNSPRT